MIRTRNEACLILGIPTNANDTQIKAAYKKLIKQYHPDSGNTSSIERYNAVRDAYAFLCAPQNKPFVIDSNKVFSQRSQSTVYQPSSASDYASFEKKIKKQKQQKAAAFEQKSKEYSQKIAKQEADYKRAMDAINAIRAARAIESMIWANGLEKDLSQKQKNDDPK